MWLKAEVREGTVRYGKHQRTRNSNKEMPGDSKPKGNDMSKKAQEWL